MAETSDRISSMAARYRRITADGLLSATATDALREQTAADIRSMAASLARQDETKGIRGFIKRVAGL